MNSAQFVDQKECYLCGGVHRNIERELGTQEGQLYLRWVRCRDCQLVYMDPRPSQHALSALYNSQGYWQGESGYSDYLAEERWRGRQAKDRAKWFVSELQSSTQSSPFKVLEVGSAAGFFLQELATQGVQAQGLDLSSPMVRLSDNRTTEQVSVTQGCVEQCQFPEDHFHGLAAWGCDSNFHDLRTTFANFSKWLKPGGLLAFNFHDYDHWSNFLKGRFKLMPNALYFLSQQHIDRLLDQHGFRRVSLRTEFCWMNLASVYHHTGHSCLGPVVQTSLARMPMRLPVPGAFRVLAEKL